MLKRVFALLVVVLVAVGSAGPAWSLPPGGSGFDYTYYSDNTYTEVVGGRFMECEGYPDSWGERTDYYDLTQWSCPPDPPTYSCTRWECYVYYDIWGVHYVCTNVTGGCTSP